MHHDLSDKVAVVTGGGSGIGAATARLFATAGAHVAVFDIDTAKAKAVAEETGALQPCIVDVADLTQVQAACREVAAAFGGIDILVNCAGIGTAETIERMSSEQWERTLAVNLSGPFNCIKAVIGEMRRRGGGAIVNVASLAAIRISYNGGAAYTASKAGLLGLTRHAAFELSGDGIRVNAVCPGPVLTPLMMGAISDEEYQQIPRSVPLGKWIQPEDVAQTILFFCRPASAQCTGTYLVVDGGLHTGNALSRESYFAKRGGPPDAPRRA